MKRLWRALGLADFFVIMCGLSVVGPLEVNKYFPFAALWHTALEALEPNTVRPMPMPAAKPAVVAMGSPPIYGREARLGTMTTWLVSSEASADLSKTTVSTLRNAHWPLNFCHVIIGKIH